MSEVNSDVFISPPSSNVLSSSVFSFRLFSFRRVNNSPVEVGRDDVNVRNALGFDLHDVLGEDYEVGAFAWRDTSHNIFLKRSVGSVNSKCSQCLVSVESLFRIPAVFGNALSILTCYGGIEAEQRVNPLNRKIRSEGKPHFGI